MNADAPQPAPMAEHSAGAALTTRIQSVLAGAATPSDGRLAALCVQACELLVERNEITEPQLLAVLARLAPAIPTLPAGSGQATAHLPARLTDRFVVLERLGTGGKGAVFKALDRVRLEAGEPERHVAVKVRDASSGEAIRQLFAEWRHAQAVSHRNIVGIHDVMKDGDLVFTVQEYVGGHSLKTLLQGTKPTPLARADIIGIIQQVGSALARFHACHRIHGDLKPANVICRPDGLVKLIDLSSVMVVPHVEGGRWIGSSEDAPVELTPSYASPERLACQDPDPADDVFSFAVTICEMLGRHPFDGMAISEFGNVEPTSLPTDLSRHGRRALIRALAPKRKDRWPTVTAFLDALRLPD